MKDLRKIVDDYIERMEGICERKILIAQKQLDYEMAEMRAFNLFRQNILNLDGEKCGNRIPEDRFFISEDGSEDRPNNGTEDLGYESEDSQA